MIAFTIPVRFPGMNEFIAATNRNRYEGAHMKKRWTDLVAWWAKALRVPRFETPVEVTFNWTEPNRRRDRDNVAAASKFVLDGLVLAGVLPNDTARWVRNVRHEFPEPDRSSVGLTVVIEGAE